MGVSTKYKALLKATQAAAKRRAAEVKFKAALKQASRPKTAWKREQREEKAGKRKMRAKANYASAMSTKYTTLEKRTKVDAKRRAEEKKRKATAMEKRKAAERSTKAAMKKRRKEAR